VLLGSLAKWTLLGTAVGMLSGSAAALFLWSLDAVTRTRTEHPWLLFLLPLGGVIVGWLYQRYGRLAGRGNNLILDQLHGAGERVPLRMAPMVLVGTLVTHLLGGSAGREGTAVQMGGSLADTLARVLRLKADDRRLLLMSGISGGFAGVFGTPLAGTIFGVEVIRAGSVRYDDPVALGHEANANGGVAGKQVTLVRLDDAADGGPGALVPEDRLHRIGHGTRLPQPAENLLELREAANGDGMVDGAAQRAADESAGRSWQPRDGVVRARRLRHDLHVKHRHTRRHVRQQRLGPARPHLLRLDR